MTSAAATASPRCGEGLEQKHCYTHEVSSENMNRLGQVSSGNTNRLGQVSSENIKGLERKHVYTGSYIHKLGFLYILTKMCEVDVSEGCSPYLIQMQTRK